MWFFSSLFFFVAKHHMAACRRNIVAETLLQKHYRRNIVAETLLQKTLLQKTLLQKTGVKCFSPYPKPPEAAEHGTDFFPPGQCKACPGIAPLRGGSGPFFTHQILQDVSDLPHRPFPVHEMPSRIQQALGEGRALLRVNDLFYISEIHSAAVYGKTVPAQGPGLDPVLHRNGYIRRTGAPTALFYALSPSDDGGGSAENDQSAVRL